MNAQLLIHSIVRQTTVLLAQLATSGGVRAPLAQIANQVFVELASEIEAQGISRKVSADMFGMTLRTYQRKIRRLSESETERGRSLWEAVYSFLHESEMVTRQQVLDRFPSDELRSIAGVLHDLVETGLVFRTGSGTGAVFRVASDGELGGMRSALGDDGLDELVWALIFHEGPCLEAQLAERAGTSPEVVAGALDRLVDSRRIEVEGSGSQRRYHAQRLFIAADSAVGWEASVYDHFQALVQTICARLNTDPEHDAHSAHIGGSTYVLEVGPNHPLRQEALSTLADFRTRCSDLRARVNQHNARHGVPVPCEEVTVYAGQSVRTTDPDDLDDDPGGDPRVP